MLKHCLLTLILLGLMYTLTAPAVAQEAGANPQTAPAGGPPERGHGHGHFDPARRAEMLSKQLNLN